MTDETRRDDDHELIEPHVEVNDEGEVYVVRDPEAETFDLDHNAPIKTETGREVDADLAAEQVIKGEAGKPRDHHLEVDLEDESADEELQDEAISEDELIDMAPARELFDDPEAASEEE